MGEEYLARVKGSSWPWESGSMVASHPSASPEATPHPSRLSQAPQWAQGRTAAWASCPREGRAGGQSSAGGQSHTGLFWKQGVWVEREGIRDRTPKVTHRLLFTAGRFCFHLLGSFFQYGHLGDSWLGKQSCRPGDQEVGKHQYNSHPELPRTLHLPEPDTPSPPCEEARGRRGTQ